VLAVHLLLLAGGLAASTLPAGFQETTIFAGLTLPTAVKFASDGRVFVAEKSGVIKVYASLSATTPTVFADLRPKVFDYWDRGLLGLELDPEFPSRPYVYVLYTLDKNPADPSAVVPTWSDLCPTPPGPMASGCPALGRLSRLDASAPWPVQASEHVLLESFPQQSPSHSIGGLAFGSDGALYLSSGEGASFAVVDYGQLGGQNGSLPGQQVPRNPLGDPPSGVGGLQTPPSAEGGALRSQSLRRSQGEPVVLSGALLRLDPNTGDALPDNPLFGDANANRRRIVAYGLRNPLRFAVRPGSQEIWIGDVGWNAVEEINHLDLAQAPANYGWPCYEGAAPQPGYQAAGLNLCQGLYAEGSARAPWFAYTHSSPVVAGDTCPVGTSSITGLAFYTTGNYPEAYQGALFFTDWARRCIWAMLPDTSGAPDPTQVVTFAAGLAGGAVALEAGPGGDLFYVDHDLGRLQRIGYESGNRSPVARATATPNSGPTPLLVQLDGSGSSDPDGDPLTYAWDFDLNGSVDSTLVSPTRTFTGSGPQQVELTVQDPGGARGTTRVTVYANNQPPQAVLITPSGGLTWKVGDFITFSGSATDPEDGPLPASALSWTLIMHHCPSLCHTHHVQDWYGLAAGSFSAPNHEYPSWLELRLTATDEGGLTHTVSANLPPQTVALTLETEPPGLVLALGSEALPTPFVRTVIVGSANSVAAPSPQTVTGVPHGFRSWSDGGSASHLFLAPATTSTLRATYRPFTDLSLTSSSSPAVEGGRLTVTATVANGGPRTATELRLLTDLPPGTTFVESLPAGACTVSGQVLGCALPDVPAGGQAPLTVILRPGRAGPLDLSLAAFAAQAESTPADNTANLEAEVRPLADLSGDFGPDLVWQSAGSGAVGVWTMNGASVTGTGPLLPTRGPDTRWLLGGLGDFDADGRPDLVWRNPQTGVTELWLMDGLSRRSVMVLPAVADPSWVTAATGDFNGDGWPDILWRHRTSGTNYLVFMNGSVATGGVVLPTVPAAWDSLGAADMNGDGQLDLLWRRSSDGQNAVWLMSGASATSSGALPSPTDVGWRLAAVADLNGDRKVDLVFRHQTSGANAVVYLNGLEVTGSASLPSVTDLSYKLIGPR
jgi:glucose/arabinose dehydrogenase